MSSEAPPISRDNGLVMTPKLATMPIIFLRGSRLLVAFVMLALASASFSGCASTGDSASRSLAPRAIQESRVTRRARASGPSADFRTVPLIPVVREGRYTLVELLPGADQEDLMQQIVDVTIPPTLTATVGDAVRYLLLRSGFTLCHDPEIRVLDNLPLAAADLHLGPMTLEEALRVLVGPGWKLKVNEMRRQVCFTPLSPPSHAGKTVSFGPITRANPVMPKPMVAPTEHRP